MGALEHGIVQDSLPEDSWSVICYVRGTVVIHRVNGTHEGDVILPHHCLNEEYISLTTALFMLFVPTDTTSKTVFNDKVS